MQEPPTENVRVATLGNRTGLILSHRERPRAASLTSTDWPQPMNHALATGGRVKLALHLRLLTDGKFDTLRGARSAGEPCTSVRPPAGVLQM